MKNLQELRGEIDQIDRQMVALFEQRMNTVVQVAEYKRINNLPVLNSGREQAVLDRCCKFLENPEYKEALCTWMQMTMDLSRELQMRYLEKR